MSQFDALAAKMEKSVDDFYGEDVQFLPFKDGGYTTGATVDSTRPVTDARAVVVSKRSAMKASSSAFITKRLEADVLLEVRDQYMANVQNNDRVVLLDPKRKNLVCEISFIEPSTNGRAFLHLMQCKDIP